MSNSADLDSVDPFAADLQQDPYWYFAALHENGGVHRNDTTGLVTVARIDLVRQVLRDTATFSSAASNEGTPPPADIAAEIRRVQATGWPRAEALIRIDPPEHTPERRLVDALLSARRVNAMESFILATAQELAIAVRRALDTAGTADFVELFAVPLPLRVICRVLGIPAEREPDVKRWSDDAVAALGHRPDPAQRLRTVQSLVEYQHFVVDKLDSGADLGSGDGEADGLTALGAAGLDLPVMLSLAHQLMVAGNETTTNLLAEGWWLLARRPDVWERVSTDPELLPSFIDELLRFASPTQGFFRTATAATEIAGCPVRAGDKVRVMFAAANRDPGLFDAPDTFDLDRTGIHEHIAFGFGAHFCADAALARMEARHGFAALIEHVGRPRIGDGYDPTYRPSAALRGLAHLHLSA